MKLVRTCPLPGYTIRFVLTVSSPPLLTSQVPIAVCPQHHPVSEKLNKVR